MDDVFPAQLHQELLRTCPDLESPSKNAIGVDGLGGAWEDVLLDASSGDAISRILGTKKGTYKTRIVRDPPGYSLGPHTDDPKKLWAFVYYLAGENGTVLFTPKKRGFQHDGTAHLDFKDFDVVKRFPFKPNSMVGFARTNTSFHGVEKINKPRYTILFNAFDA